MYPNSASEFVYIALPSTVIPAQTGIYMYNLLGQEIPCQARNDGSGKLSIDVRDLPEGIYLLHIRDKNDNLIKTERIVIAR
ncbi:MAG: T9SS type A sorting domain-containing protein [Chitinophagales bacterium]